MSASASDLYRDEPARAPLFEALYEEHFDYVWTNLRRLGVHGPDLDDAVQETFLVVHRRLDDLDRDASSRGWLFGIARRIASRHRRGLGRRVRRLAALQAVPPRSGDSEAELGHTQAARLLQGFLDRLDPKKREVFILAELEGMSGVEIAAALGVPVNTVGSRLRAARAAFEGWVEVLRARERGAAARLDRRALVLRSREARPPARSRERVRNALAACLVPSAEAAPWWLAAKPLALTVGLGVAGMGVALGVLHRDRVAPTAQVEASSPVERERGSPGPRRTASSSVPAVEGSAGDPLGAAASPEPPAAATPTADASPSGRAAPAGTSARPGRGPRPRPDAAAQAQASADTIAAEAALVARIRAAARGPDPAAALVLADEHARSFPGGLLELERWALVIAASCRLGRVEQAAAQARTWARSHPEAPLPAEVRHGCGDAEKEIDESGG